MDGLERARSLLRERFGHPEFRPAQARVIRAVLAGRDVLGVLPTGIGKSACFQIPAALDEGTTVVVSPLLSLIEDQVGGARRRGFRACAWTSTTSPEEREAGLRAHEAGMLDLLYASPERLENRRARRRIGRAPVARLVVDEAHCISEWGHDFRPSYLRIGEAHGQWGRPPLLALTATAPWRTRREIERSLGLRAPVRVLLPVDRPNLRLEVTRHPEARAAAGSLVADVRACPGPVIAFTPSRIGAARLALALSRRGIAAAGYHAGLPSERRIGVQEAFLAGRLRAVCATSAFGMGIDHPGVRFVAHLGAPRSLEQYVQEAGRAGRDGEPARCVLYAIADEPRTPAWLAEASRGRGARRRWEAMRDYARGRECRRAAIARYFGEPVPDCAGCDGCDGRAAGPEARRGVRGARTPGR